MSCHSLRRGGAVYRVFDAAHTLSLTDICAWARWESPGTLAGYLCDHELARSNNPTMLLRPKQLLHKAHSFDQSFNSDKFLDSLAEKICNRVQFPVQSTTPHIQSTGFTIRRGKVHAIDSKDIKQQTSELSVVNQRQIQQPLYITTLPPLKNGVKSMWNQWFNRVPGTVLYKPLKDFCLLELQFPKTKANTIWKDYWKRQKFAKEFVKYKSWDEFANSYGSAVKTIKGCYKEVQNRIKNQ